MIGPITRHFTGDRYELKYFIPNDWIEEIKKDLSGYVQYDPFSAVAPGHKYAVRSIYFDNDRLDFYYEKLDGLRIRKKLRVRTYGNGNENPVYFLEIKRRYSEVIYKERAVIPPELLLTYVFGRQSFNGEVHCEKDLKRLLQRFSYNLEFRDLRPTALVVYDREALVGLDNPRIRITFDTNLSTYPFPGFADFFTPHLFPVTRVQKAILEIKFDQSMPGWLRNIVKKYALYRQPISKYCLCLDEIRQTGMLASYSKNGNGVTKEWKTFS